MADTFNAAAMKALADPAAKKKREDSFAAVQTAITLAAGRGEYSVVCSCKDPAWETYRWAVPLLKKAGFTVFENGDTEIKVSW